MSEIPAGWYPDPYETPNLYRWWDGVQWTDHTAPMTPEQPQAGSAGSAGSAEPAQTAEQVQQPQEQQPQEQWHAGGPESGFGQGVPPGGGFGQSAPDSGFGQGMPPAQGPMPGWEPRTEPPPWNTQDGPPVLDDVQSASPAPWSEPAPQPAPTTEWQAEQPQSQPEQPQSQPPSQPQAQAPVQETAAPDATPAHETCVDQQGQPPHEPGDMSGQTWEPPSDVGKWAQPYSDWNAQDQAVPAFQPIEPAPSSGEPWGPPSPAPGGPRYPSEPPKKGRGLLVGALAGGIALVLIIVATIGVFVVRRNQADDRHSPSPTQTTSAQSTAPSSTQPASPAPTGPRINAGSISYVQLPAPWEPNDQQQFPEFDTKKGQYQYTQRNPPGVEGGWIANVFVGSLSDQFSYGGPEDLESTAGGLATSVEQNYYKPWKTKRKDLERKKITIDGKQGYQIKFHLDFLNTPKGFAAKGETVLVAVLDSSTGGQGVYISIPDNAKKLEPTFDLVMNSLQVN